MDLSHLIELENRAQEAGKEFRTGTTLFSELKIPLDCYQVFAEFTGIDSDQLAEYLRSKLNGNLVLENSAFTTREDWPDIQAIFLMGFEYLKEKGVENIDLKKFNIE